MEYCPRAGGIKPGLGQENMSINRQREIAANYVQANKSAAMQANTLQPMTKANYVDRYK